MSDGTFEGRRLISEKNLRATQTSRMVVRYEADYARDTEMTQYTYGLGWNIQDYRAHHTVWHGGAIDDFHANITLAPKAKLGIIVLTNQTHSNIRSALRSIYCSACRAKIGSQSTLRRPRARKPC